MPGRVAHGTFAHDLGRRHPFEVAMLLAAAFVGLSRLLEPTSGTLERELPTAMVLGWYAFLASGSLIALAGVWWKEPTAGLLIERAGLFLLTSSGLVYTITLVASGGWRAVAAASFVLGFAGASAVRAFDIGRVIVRMKALALARRAVLEGDSKE